MLDAQRVTNPLLNATLEYARRGLYVFPTHDVSSGACSCGQQCASPGKHPRTTHGFHDSTTDEATIVAWWTAHPTAGIGLDCGRSNRTVVDVDVKKGALGRATSRWLLERYPEAFAAAELYATPSGGFHFHFAGAGKSGTGTLGPGVDTRGVGGYVLLPPSTAFGKYDENKKPVPGSQAPYALLRPAVELPPLPPDIALALAVASPQAALTGAFSLGDIATEARTFDGAARASIPYGEHRSSVLWEGWHIRRVQGLTVEAGLRALRAFVDSGVLEGYNPADPFTDRDLRGMLERIEPAIAANPPAITTNPFVRVGSGEDAFALERPLVWLWPLFLPRDELVLLYGAGGVGKSTLAGWIAALATQHGDNVGVVCIEEPVPRFVSRAIAMGAVKERIKYPLEAVTGLRFREHLAWIEAFIVENNLRVLYFDSIRSHFELGKGEDSATNARNNLAGIAALAQRTGCLILGTFHDNKTGEYSGSTEMLNVPRIVLGVKEPSANKITVRVHKSNFCKPEHRLVFERRIEPYFSGGAPVMETTLVLGGPSTIVQQKLPLLHFMGTEPLGTTTLGEAAGVNEALDDAIRRELSINPGLSANLIRQKLGGKRPYVLAAVARIKAELRLDTGP